MPYTQVTLDQFAIQIGIVLDDTNELYWTRMEKYFAIWDALRVWGAYTNYWRARGTFNLVVGHSYYNLATVLPALRTRAWTLDQLTREIQFMCLEAANGISGAGMSGQIGVDSILQSIRRARNKFVIDAKFPYTYHSNLAPVDPNGFATYPDETIYLHRASWQDAPSSTWTNLWREDAWSIDRANPNWTLEAGPPRVYSESEQAPLQLQLSPIPLNVGTLDGITIDSLLIDITDPAATFDVPDEWIHAIKFAALADLFSAESQNTDPVRAQYADMRYQQAMDLAHNARSVMRLLSQGIPLAIDSLQAIDAGSPYWRNQVGPPQMAGILYDFVAVNPGSPDQAYGIGADVVQSAPIPTAGGDFMPIGAEDLSHIESYVTHVLTFKCGGKEFQDTFPGYDSFLEAVASRGRINRAKMRFMSPLMGQPQAEQSQRPDMWPKEATAQNA